MPLPPVLSILLPLVGVAGTLGVFLVPHLRRFALYIALSVVGLTTCVALMIRWMEPDTVILSLWQPSLLFGAALALQTDPTVQPLALVLPLMTCSAMLVGLSRAEEPHPRLAAALLALLCAGLLALWAGNPLTMVISWAIYDVLQAAAHIAAGGSVRSATRGLIFGGVATLLLWGGALLSAVEAGSELWSLMTPNGAQLTLWAVSGMLRLWVYPLHLSIPDDLEAAPSLAAPLLLGPVLGWGLWLRLVLANGGLFPGGTWVLTTAAATLALGGFLAWSCESPRRTLPWIGMGVTGAVLLAAGLAGEAAAAVVAAGSVAWALGVAVLFLSGGLQREAPLWNVPSLVGAWALLGAPLTLGFVTGATLTGGLMREGHLGWGGAFFVGHLFLVPSLVRWLLLPSSSPPPHRRWPRVARGVGLGLPALVLILAGLHPPLLSDRVLASTLGTLLAMPGLMGWMLWTVSVADGGVLAWQEGNLRSRIQLLLNAAHDLLRLEWLYGAVVGALDRGLSALRAADEVVGGAGALLWSWLLFLLLVLAWGGR